MTVDGARLFAMHEPITLSYWSSILKARSRFLEKHEYIFNLLNVGGGAAAAVVGATDATRDGSRQGAAADGEGRGTGCHEW